MIDDVPQSPEDCLADCAHLFPDRETEDSYGNLQYRIAIARIELLMAQRAGVAAIKAIEEAHAAVMRSLVAPLGKTL